MAKTNEYRPSHFQDWRNDPDKARPLTNTLPSRLTDHVAVANSYRGETCEGALDLPDGRTLVVWENMPAFIVDRVVVLNEEQTILAKQAYFQKYESAFAGLRSLVPLAPQSAKDRLSKRREQAQKAQDTGVLLADVIDEGEYLPFISGLTIAEQEGGLPSENIVKRDLAAKQAKTDAVTVVPTEKVEGHD